MKRSMRDLEEPHDLMNPAAFLLYSPGKPGPHRPGLHRVLTLSTRIPTRPQTETNLAALKGGFEKGLFGSIGREGVLIDSRECVWPPGLCLGAPYRPYLQGNGVFGHDIKNQGSMLYEVSAHGTAHL